MSATILVVDDDPVILQLLQVNFEMEGFEVVTAANGFVNDVEGNSTQTVQFVSTDDLSGQDPATFTYELQNDF